MENVPLISSLLIIAVGVLQIFLFFKLWGMATNVKRINKTVSGCLNQKDSFQLAKIEMLIGNRNKAIDIYNRSFILDLLIIYKQQKYQGSDFYERNFSSLKKLYIVEMGSIGDQLDFAKYDTYKKLESSL